jgi:hypothetical protein
MAPTAASGKNGERPERQAGGTPPADGNNSKRLSGEWAWSVVLLQRWRRAQSISHPVPEVGDASDKWGPYNQGHFCLFRINFTLLAPLHIIGASGSFDFEKEGQTCKVKKSGTNAELEVKIGAVLQLTLF